MPACAPLTAVQLTTNRSGARGAVGAGSVAAAAAGWAALGGAGTAAGAAPPAQPVASSSQTPSSAPVNRWPGAVMSDLRPGDAATLAVRVVDVDRRGRRLAQLDRAAIAADRRGA